MIILWHERKVASYRYTLVLSSTVFVNLGLFDVNQTTFHFGLPFPPFFSLSLTPLAEFLSYFSRRSLGSGSEMLVYFCSFAGDGRFANTGVWNVCSLQSKWIFVRKLLDSLLFPFLLTSIFLASLFAKPVGDKSENESLISESFQYFWSQ